MYTNILFSINLNFSFYFGGRVPEGICHLTLDLFALLDFHICLYLSVYKGHAHHSDTIRYKSHEPARSSHRAIGLTWCFRAGVCLLYSFCFAF